MDDLLLTAVMARLDEVPLDGPAEARLLAALEAGVDQVWTGPDPGWSTPPRKRKWCACPSLWATGASPATSTRPGGALSNACDAHPYDLAPTAAELQGWAAVVARLLTATVTLARS